MGRSAHLRVCLGKVLPVWLAVLKHFMKKSKPPCGGSTKAILRLPSPANYCVGANDAANRRAHHHRGAILLKAMRCGSLKTDSLRFDIDNQQQPETETIDGVVNVEYRRIQPVVSSSNPGDRPAGIGRNDRLRQAAVNRGGDNVDASSRINSSGGANNRADVNLHGDRSTTKANGDDIAAMKEENKDGGFITTVAEVAAAFETTATSVSGGIASSLLSNSEFEREDYCDSPSRSSATISSPGYHHQNGATVGIQTGTREESESLAALARIRNVTDDVDSNRWTSKMECSSVEHSTVTSVGVGGCGGGEGRSEEASWGGIPATLSGGRRSSSTDNYSSVTSICSVESEEEEASLAGPGTGVGADSGATFGDPPPGSCGVTAVEKDSDDPFLDFCSSIAEMVVVCGLTEEAELEELFLNYVRLNAPQHHHAIALAFLHVLQHLGN